MAKSERAAAEAGDTVSYPFEQPVWGSYTDVKKPRHDFPDTL
ncbi:hypothetical protein [Paenibacillus beijingensis]|nr:hypothetical protein [Paenibacillus beijingensis]